MLHLNGVLISTGMIVTQVLVFKYKTKNELKWLSRLDATLWRELCQKKTEYLAYLNTHWSKGPIKVCLSRFPSLTYILRLWVQIMRPSLALTQFLWYLRLVAKVEAFPIVIRRSEERRRQLENLEELGVAERGGDLPVLRQAPVGVGLADLVHLARQLTQKLDTDHAVISRTL